MHKALGQKISGDSPFFFTGRKPNDNGTSVYIDVPLGINEIKNAGKFVARALGKKEDADEYTGKFIPLF